jgi:hypothetical protein
VGVVGNAGLYTIARDLLLWQQNFADVRVGTRALVAAMQTPPVLAGRNSSSYAFGGEPNRSNSDVYSYRIGGLASGSHKSVEGPYSEIFRPRPWRIVPETDLVGSSLPTGSHEIPTNSRLLPTAHSVSIRRVAPFTLDSYPPRSAPDSQEPISGTDL